MKAETEKVMQDAEIMIHFEELSWHLEFFEEIYERLRRDS
jgi:hypothetical protein